MEAKQTRDGLMTPANKQLNLIHSNIANGYALSLGQ